MATMSIDELNSFEPEKYIEDYFKPMPISEDRKEERRDAAKDFRDILLLILALIAIEYEKNLLDWAYIQEQFRKELLNASLKYAAESEAIQDYVNTKSNDFIDTTKEQDLSDPYWTSDMRATHEAVNEANDVISISEMQRAEELGAVQKRWKTERDTKVRPTHRAVDGAVENIDDMFGVGKDLMRFPHDWYYSAKESYNCRCGLDYLDENGKVVLVGKMKEEVNKNYNKVQFTKINDNDRIQVRGIIENAEDRNIANGQRRGNRNILTEDDIELIKNEAEAIGIPVELLAFNEGGQTGFYDLKQIIHVRGDVFPLENGTTARSRMSVRAVLAHEYYGHYKNYPSPYRIGSWEDEYFASRNASLYAPNLSDTERRDLMIDAYDRQKEAGVFVGYDEEARKIIYGF